MIYMLLERNTFDSIAFFSQCSQVKFRSSATGRTCLCQYRASTANPSAVLVQYQDGCKQRAMSILDSWYRAEDWRGTGILQPQSWDQVSANNQLRSNASTEPVQILVLAWYRCPVPRQYRASTDGLLPVKLNFGAAPVVGRAYASIAPVFQILLRYWRGTKLVVNFHLEYNIMIQISTNLVGSVYFYDHTLAFLCAEKKNVFRTIKFLLMVYFYYEIHKAKDMRYSYVISTKRVCKSVLTLDELQNWISSNLGSHNSLYEEDFYGRYWCPEKETCQ